MRYFFRYVIFIGFTFLFFSLFLFLPHEEVSKQENRTLAPKPVLFQNSTLNLNFGSDLDAYLKDHFPHRKNLISSYLRGRYIIGGRLENKYAIAGKNGWMFSKDNTFKNSRYKEKELEYLSKKLKRLNQLFKKHQIHFFILVVPSKMHVYSEYLMPFVDIERMHNKIFMLKEYLENNNSEIFFFYPLSAMIKNKNRFITPLYQKGDQHPTGWGYFVLYQELMKEIQKIYPAIRILEETDFKLGKKPYMIGSERRFLGFYDKILEYPHLVFNQNFKIEKHKRGEHSYWKNIYKQGKFNVFYMGTSIGDEMHKMMIPSFKKTIFMRENIEKQSDNNEDIFSDLFRILLEEKIDVFVLEMPETRMMSNRFSERLDDILNSYKD